MSATWLSDARARVDRAFEDRMRDLAWHPELQFMARHVLVGAGKAVRPALVYWSFEKLASVPAPEWLDAWALALEMVHTYSLVHDDLPAMDNDDFRRGKATLHKLKSEAAAILAGDALLTGAFEVLALTRGASDSQSFRSVLELSRASGGFGMVSGQMRDMFESSDSSRADELAALDRTHREKTGALFGAALALGVLAARSDVSNEKLALARSWGIELGLLFQIVDDVLDATASSQALGKTAGKDAESGKRTYVKLLGIHESRSRAESLKQKLFSSSEEWGMPAHEAQAVLEFFTQRKS